MKELTAASVVALHAMQLMMRRNGAVTIKEIHQSSGFPLDLIRSILSKLQGGGMVQKGTRRGFALARAPGEIAVLDVIRSVDPPRAPAAPCGGDFDACASRGACLLAPLCRQAEQGFQETLRAFTLAELMNQPAGLPNCLDPKFRAEAS